MSDVLLVAEQFSGSIRKGTWNALSAARELARRTGGKVQAVLLGSGVAPLAEELAAHGVAVQLADAPALQHYLAESWAPVVAEVARATGAGLVRPGPAETLTGLFRRARYSTYPMTSADSTAAADALDELRADLASQEPGP